MEKKVTKIESIELMIFKNMRHSLNKLFYKQQILTVNIRRI